MKKIMYREAIASALAEEMRRDEKVFVMVIDSGSKLCVKEIVPILKHPSTIWTLILDKVLP